jgi:hypothetical protein
MTGPRSLRRLDWLNEAIAHALDEMRNGQSLHLQYEPAGPVWRLAAGRRLHDAVARMVIVNPNVISVGDALFESAPSQTYRWISEE